MAKKAKSKKPSRGGKRHPRKTVTPRPGKKARAHARKAAHTHVAPAKPLLPSEPKHVPPTKTMFARKHKAKPRAFVIAAQPAANSASSSLPMHKKKKKKPQMVLRFTENTLKDIAALECVRRCFR